MKKYILMTMVPILLFAVIMSSACEKKYAETLAVSEGSLPTLYIGDKWVYEEIAQGLDSTRTYELTGEDVTDGKNCYVMQESVEYSKRESPWAFPSPPNPLNLNETLTEKFDKETMQVIREEQSSTNGTDVEISTHSYSYKFKNGLPYPLEAGKECKFAITGTWTYTNKGQPTTNKSTATNVLQVEGIEEITVPAGTFNCFKINHYMDNGTLLYSSWYSDEVKSDVKKSWPTDNTTGHEFVLVSYSVH